MNDDRHAILVAVKKRLANDANFKSDWEKMIEQLTLSDSLNDLSSLSSQFKQAGILDKVLQEMQPRDKPVLEKQFTNVENIATIDQSGSVPDRVNILFHVKKLTALVDYKSMEELPQQERPVIQLAFSFNKQRHASDLHVANVDIDMSSSNTCFTAVLQLPRQSSLWSLTSLAEHLLNAKQTVVVYLLEYRLSSESWIPSLKMYGLIEWRHCLHSPSGVSLKVDLKGVGQMSQLGLGTLHVDVACSLPFEFDLSNDIIELSLTVEASKKTEAERSFISYARLWHKDFVEINPAALSRRAVRLFVHDEFGRVRFPSALVQPLDAGRLMETPQQCARFVSLLSTAPSQITSENDDTWYSIDASLLSSNSVRSPLLLPLTHPP